MVTSFLFELVLLKTPLKRTESTALTRRTCVHSLGFTLNDFLMASRKIITGMTSSKRAQFDPAFSPRIPFT